MGNFVKVFLFKTLSTEMCVSSFQLISRLLRGNEALSQKKYKMSALQERWALSILFKEWLRYKMSRLFQIWPEQKSVYIAFLDYHYQSVLWVELCMWTKVFLSKATPYGWQQAPCFICLIKLLSKDLDATILLQQDWHAAI